ncbi:MAG: CDP-alcohol phosphatidyltransferase family protein [Bacteroidota bacterium]
MAIKYAFEWDLVMAAYLVGIAAVLDFFDGFLARLLKVSGDLGKQLDSLADVVSFGVVPGVVMFQYLKFTAYQDLEYPVNETDYEVWYFYISFLIPLFSAFRLAKFNIDERQSSGFLGLPTPANAIFFCSIPLIFAFYSSSMNDITPKRLLEGDYSIRYCGENKNIIEDNFHKVISCGYLETNSFMEKEFQLKQLKKYTNESLNTELLTNTKLLLILIIIFSLLLVSNLPLFALKFKNFGWADNKIRYIFVVISLAMLIILQLVAIPFIILLYIVLSVLNHYIFKL